jgi:hypothetical protein
MATHSMPDISEIIAEVKTLRSQLAVAVEALEKLSCLGNGDIRGNSDGNIIASTAIDTINDKQIGGES